MKIDIMLSDGTYSELNDIISEIVEFAIKSSTVNGIIIHRNTNIHQLISLITKSTLKNFIDTTIARYNEGVLITLSRADVRSQILISYYENDENAYRGRTLDTMFLYKFGQRYDNDKMRKHYDNIAIGMFPVLVSRKSSRTLIYSEENEYTKPMIDNGNLCEHWHINRSNV